MKMHGNSKYTPEIAQEIANLLASNHTLKEIQESVSIDQRTICRWIVDNEEFAGMCTRARVSQAEVIADEILQTIRDVKTAELDPDRARVMLSSMQWLASKRNPKVFGDRQILAGDAENPINLLAARLDAAVKQSETPKMIDVTPAAPDDGSDLV